jgi:hypothetical protein
MKIPSGCNPTSAFISPTVGAKCHRGERAYATGWLKLGPTVHLADPEEGRCGEDRAQNTLQTHRATQVRGPREEVTPLLLHV